MKANGDTVEDSAIVEKILRSLSEKYEAKVTSIEECNTAATMTLNELLGSLQACEQRLLEKTVAAKQVEEALESQVSWRSNQGKPNAGGYRGRKPVDRKVQCYNCGIFAHFSADLTTCVEKDLFESLDESVRSTVKFGNNSTIPVMGKGRIGIVLKNGVKTYIMDVFNVPGLHQNLLSMGQFSERGYGMNIFSDVCFIRDKEED
ncbi:uncharacterized protein LOC113311884 [Papaver somniferum]|uniref:uncharacterized protein LOC113311884 n=1 Tax=Papaver somniferum TaxID=3469 RepID=UPI000E6FE2C0|nr:uncharacterized protein LOC113311884 [Papaver somniferum]